MDTIKELLVKQAQQMGCVQRALANFKKLGQARMTPAVTSQRLALLKESFARCQETDLEIAVQTDGKAQPTLPYWTESQFLRCEEAFHEAADFMAEILARTATGPAAPTEDSTRTSSRLPRLPLPTFSGDFNDWEAFRDKFRSLIINDSTVSNVDRMHFLASCVTGDAAKALDNLAITDGNFQIAWKILSSRYENKRRLITYHLNTLTSLPTVTRETAENLRDLRDKTSAAMQALINLARPVDKWDDLLVFLVSQRLDPDTRKAWEFELGDTVEYPSFAKLNHFLDSRIRALESMPESPSKNNRDQVDPPKKPERYRSVSSHAATVASPCPVCRDNHLLFQCDEFKNKSPSQRYDLIRKTNRCLNCFSTKHTVKDCASEHTCKQCRSRHHTLLHFATSVTVPTDTKIQNSDASTAYGALESVHTHLNAEKAATNAQVLLATARVRVYSPSGHYVEARALLDQGSAATIVTEKLVQSLRLSKMRRAIRISGVGDNATPVRHAVHLTISPAFAPAPTLSTTALVLRTLTRYAPHRTSDSYRWNHIADLQLADDDPLSSDPIDLLIGADLYGSLLLDGVRKGSENQPTAQRSILGWILSGPASPSYSPSSIPAHHAALHTAPPRVVTDDTSALEAQNDTLHRFWEVEDLPKVQCMSEEEQQTEEHSMTTHTRTHGGRYVVRLPLKTGPHTLGASRPAALSRLLHVEKRLARESEQRAAYPAFMAEYLQLDHVEPTHRTQHQNVRTRCNVHHSSSIRSRRTNHACCNRSQDTAPAIMALQVRVGRTAAARPTKKMGKILRVPPGFEQCCRTALDTPGKRNKEIVTARLRRRVESRVRRDRIQSHRSPRRQRIYSIDFGQVQSRTTQNNEHPAARTIRRVPLGTVDARCPSSSSASGNRLPLLDRRHRRTHVDSSIPLALANVRGKPRIEDPGIIA